MNCTPCLNEDHKKDIIAILDQTDFGIVEAYCGLYFEIDENNKYEDAKQYLDCLDFLNLFRGNTYFDVYHTLQSIDGVEPATALNWHGGEINYKKPIDVYIWKSNQDKFCYVKFYDLRDYIFRHRFYPLYMINNQYMTENIILTSKEILTEITYDWKQRLILSSPLSVSKDNIRNLAFVKELLKHDFHQFMILPDEIKQNEEIKDIAIKQAFNFLSKQDIDDYYTSLEFIKSELGITD